MKRLNCTRFALLLILVLGLGACGDDVYYTDDYLRNSDEKLCGKTWTENLEADDNMDCVHQLKFSQNRSGQEIFEIIVRENRALRVLKLIVLVGNG